MNLVCECGKVIAKGTYHMCRESLCLDHFCSSSCQDRHEAKHISAELERIKPSPNSERKQEEVSQDFDWSKAFNLRYLQKYYLTHLK